MTVTLNGTTLHMRNAAGEMLDYVSANGRGTVSLVLQSSVVPVAWGIYGTHEGSWAGACDGACGWRGCACVTGLRVCVRAGRPP